MEVPEYSLAERDRRWALARKLMAAEDIDALIVYGWPGCAGTAGLVPDAYFSNDLPGSVVIFCRDADPVRLVWSTLPVQAHLEAAGRGCQLWIGPASIRVGADTAGIAGVLREHGLEHGRAGVLGLSSAAHWQPGPAERCRRWWDVRALLPQVRLKSVDRSFLFLPRLGSCTRARRKYPAN